MFARDLNLALVFGAGIVVSALLGSSAAKPVATRTVVVGLGTNTTSTAHLAEQIRSQLRGQGVRVSQTEARNAAAASLNQLKGKNRDPQKGIILIHFKKLKATVCISWGEHKDYCNKHQSAGFAGMKALSL